MDLFSFSLFVDRETAVIVYNFIFPTNFLRGRRADILENLHMVVKQSTGKSGSAITNI